MFKRKLGQIMRRSGEIVWITI